MKNTYSPQLGQTSILYRMPLIIIDLHGQQFENAWFKINAKNKTICQLQYQYCAVRANNRKQSFTLCFLWNNREEDTCVSSNMLSPKICCSFKNLSTECRAVNVKQSTAKFSKKQEILGLSYMCEASVG